MTEKEKLQEAVKLLQEVIDNEGIKPSLIGGGGFMLGSPAIIDLINIKAKLERYIDKEMSE